MTRVDHNLLAYTIYATLHDNTTTAVSAAWAAAADGVLTELANTLANSLEPNSPRFDRSKFLSACGVVDYAEFHAS